MTVKVIATAAEYDSILATSRTEGTLVLIDFHAEWCGPCKMLAPKIVTLSEENPDVLFFKLDVDAVQEVASRIGITAMPTIIVYKKGEKIGEVVGANEPAIRKLVLDNK